MYHRNYTTYLNKELDFLKLLVSRFHEMDEVNELELGIAMQKTQEIYEHFLKIKLTPNVAKPTVAAEKTIAEPQPQPQPQPQPVIVPAPEKVVVVKETKKPTPTPVPTPVVPVQEENKQKSSILAEKISPSEPNHINETLAQQKSGNDLSSKLQTAPLNSIASGIGLNDRFLYTRELFKNDGELYNRSIKHLDRADSLEKALEFIDRHFDWDEKDETAQKFLALIYRRHG